MRKINFIIVHSDENPFHRSYHYIINKDHTITHEVPDFLSIFTAEGLYQSSISICLSGEAPHSEEQYRLLKEISYKLLESYKLSRIDLVAHKSLNKNTECPGFDLNEIIMRY